MHYTVQSVQFIVSCTVGVRRGAERPPRTAHLFFLGVRRGARIQILGFFVLPSVRPFGFLSFSEISPINVMDFASFLCCFLFSAAGPPILTNFEWISYVNFPSGRVLAFLVNFGATLCQSWRLSSARDWKWKFEESCASNRNRTLQLLLENPDGF